jgi:hypothetical protein
VAPHGLEKPSRHLGRLANSRQRCLDFGMIEELARNKRSEKVTSRGDMNYTVRLHVS